MAFIAEIHPTLGHKGKALSRRELAIPKGTTATVDSLRRGRSVRS
jgi:hypothetical protein